MKKIIYIIFLIHLTSFTKGQSNSYDLIPYFQNGKWGYMNQDKKLVIPAKYDDVDLFFENKAVVSINNKKGLINTSGEFIIQPIYDNLVWNEKGKWGSKNVQGYVLKFNEFKSDGIRYIFNDNGEIINLSIGYITIKEPITL